METKNQKFYCEYDAKKNHSSFDFRLIEMPERIFSGVKILGILWVIAIGCILVPFLHFILVPGFLFLGMVFGYASWETQFEIMKGNFLCPNCDQENSVAGESYRLPRNRRCDKCSVTLQLKSSFIDLP